MTLSDAVPDNSKFVSNSGAAGWSCTNPSTKGPDPKTGTITCTTSSLASGDSATFTILVEVKLKGEKPKSGTTITNRAMVSSSTSDPNTGNNSAAATTRVIGK